MGPCRVESSVQEPVESVCELAGGFLGHVVAEVDDGTRNRVFAPAVPDGCRVAIKVFHVVVAGPGHDGVALNPTSRGAVRLVVGAVNVQAGSLVFEHRADRRRLGDGADHVVMVLGTHELTVGPVPGQRVSGDDAFAWSEETKNQCHHCSANRASARSRASAIGTLSSTASRSTRSG